MRDPYSTSQGFEPNAEGGPISSANLAVQSEMLSQFAGKPQGRPYAVYFAFVLCAVALVAVLVHELMAPPEPGTAIVQTSPLGVTVTVDGKPASAEGATFTLAELTPGVEHVVEISKEGFKPETRKIQLEEGEVKTLPSVTLQEIVVDTGFTLDSVPTGATVFLDGAKLGAVTPFRVTDLAPGEHTVRLEYGFTHEPWETKFELAKGQMVAMPPVSLVALPKWKAKKAERDAAKAAANPAAVTPPEPIPAAP
jgi:hypothetical protein